ncbi:hypothetical protein ABZY68_02075 [Streptomyces sp. NPDC006482]|uniref:hypothetical protein n=1 Tax=Streptomyces sp. NPDC006482 TaxID=3154306 RepID=UPI0033A113CB
MPEWVDGEERGPSRRSLLRTAGALLPALVLGVGGAAGTATAAGTPRTAADTAPRGTFSSPGYDWTAVPGSGAASGVVFTLTGPDGRPLSGRRVRFSLSAFHTVRPSLWFEVDAAPKRLKSPEKYGYMDLDTDARGRVTLGSLLRHGAVPTGAAGLELRAQLVGTETILATSRLSVSDLRSTR